jgi:rhodanese-related sulfurtransferase
MQEFSIFLSHHPFLSLGIAAAFLLLMVVEFYRTKHKQAALSPTQAVQHINHDQAVVIDLRPIELYRKGHIIGAQQFNAATLLKENKALEKLNAKNLIIVCAQGHESQKIASQLLKRGFKASPLAGGMRAWSEASLPVIKEEK